MDRRQFLRAMFATAVASQLPALPKADAGSLVEQMAERFTATINGQIPASVSVSALANGWYRVIAEYAGLPAQSSDGASFDLDLTSLNGGKGLYVGDARHLQIETGDVMTNRAEVQQTAKGYTFSMFFKPQ